MAFAVRRLRAGCRAPARAIAARMPPAPLQWAQAASDACRRFRPLPIAPQSRAMLPQRIIATKRDGAALSREMIDAFVAGLTSGTWSDSQAAALAMAIVLRGMDAAETVALTEAMTASGERLHWRAFGDRPVLDKHSTGGVGDKLSLMLAPIIAACGGGNRSGPLVPMISGRGLGHTGGTLDKLEALPGYDVNPSRERLHAALRDAGCAIVGASDTLAPADRRLYAIRDVTATVESVPLITASILSKKLAAGLGALVLDVKCGSGAMMRTRADARTLASSLVRVAAGAGLKARALVTDMDQVLGHSAGNALEVREAIDFLTGAGRAARAAGGVHDTHEATGAGDDARQRELTLALCAELLCLGGVAPDLPAAHARAECALDSGAAAERFARMVAALGGPRDVLRDAGLGIAPEIVAVPAPRAGFVQAIDVRALGLAVVALGGGRARPGERIDPRVGLARVLPRGAAVRAGTPLAQVHAATPAQAADAARAVAGAFTIGEAAPALPPVVLEVVS
jgi:thymidine phosphorylase